MKRRTFLQNTALASVGLAMFPSLADGLDKSNRKIGLQLYSVRDRIAHDPKEVLKQLARFGYRELEAYSYRDGKIFGLPYGEFCTCATQLGMKVVSGHYNLEQVRGDTWQRAIEDAVKCNQKLMVCPYIEPNKRKTIDDYKRVCADLNAAGEVCNKNGIRFAYHNHDFEFNEMDREIPYDLMLKELDPDKVGMELDLFWIVYAGKSPLEYFKMYPGRFEAWHIKDMDKADRNLNTDLGTGSIDFVSILSQARLSGCHYFFVEQETYPVSSMESVRACARYLKSVL